MIMMMMMMRKRRRRRKKSKGKKKKSGRKSAWSPDDFIDIVVSNFFNTKCQTHSKINENILTELRKKASARGKVYNSALNNCVQSSENVLVTTNKQHSPYEQPRGSKDSKKTEGLATGLNLY